VSRAGCVISFWQELPSFPLYPNVFDSGTLSWWQVAIVSSRPRVHWSIGDRGLSRSYGVVNAPDVL